MSVLPFSNTGSGRPFLLLHSFPADRRVWTGVAAILSQSLRVIVPDLHGFGANPPASHLSIALMAADVARLARDLGVAPCAIAGLSMGGYVAQAIARDEPEVIDRLILCDTKAAADTPAQRDARDAMAALATEHGSAAVFGKMRPTLLAADAPLHVVEAARQMAAEQSPLTLAAAMRAMRDRDDFSAFLPSATIPIHLIYGDKDAAMPPDAARALHASLRQHLHAGAPAATLTLISGAGHMSPLEKPAEVAAAILAVLK